MSSQHKAPLAAFLVVSIACVVVVVNALRSDALSGLFAAPTQAVVAGARLVPQPQDILAAEARIVIGATAGLRVAPRVVEAVVDSAAGHAGARTKHAQRRAVRGTAALTVAPAATVSTPSSATSGSTGPASHQTQPSLPGVRLPSYGHPGQRGHAAPASHAPNARGGLGTRTDRGNGAQDRSSRHEGHGRSGHSTNGWTNDRGGRSDDGARSQDRPGKDRSDHRSDNDRSGNRGHGWGSGRHDRA